jgi:hypothetical protein
VGVKVKRFATNIYLYRASGYYEKNTFNHYLKAHRQAKAASAIEG